MSDKANVYSLIEQHYKDHYRSSVQSLSYKLGGVHNAEDVVQEAYTRALTYWKSYNLSSGLDQWITAILGNCVKDFLIDTISNGLVKEDLAAMPEPPRFDMHDHLFAEEVKDTISRLPGPMRFMLELYLIEGYTSQEVADLMEETTADAVRKTVSRFKENYLAA